MQNVFVDDGMGAKFAAVDSEGELLPASSWDELLDKYSPIRIFTENSFQAKHPAEHDRILLKAMGLGNELQAINPRITATYRRLWGQMKGTDVDDAKLLRRIAYETNVHWSQVRERGLVLPSLQQQAEDLGKKGVTAILGKYRELDPRLLGALGNGQTYDTVAALFVALAVASKDRSDFLKKLGADGDGYPSIARATFYRRVRTLVKRFATYMPFDVPEPVVDRPDESPEHTAWRGERKRFYTPLWLGCQRNLRKALILMYHKVRCADKTDSEKDKRHSRSKARARTISIPKKTTHIPARVQVLPGQLAFWEGLDGDL
jgi:hypothetical protein